MSTKEDVVTGVITVSIFGVQGAFTAQDVANWGTIFLSMSPAILIIFLLWRMRKLDQQHADCTQNQNKTQEQLILTYRALQNVQLRRNLPPEEDFKEGSFDLEATSNRSNQ